MQAFQVTNSSPVSEVSPEQQGWHSPPTPVVLEEQRQDSTSALTSSLVRELVSAVADACIRWTCQHFDLSCSFA
jgi:hypothetical protein